MKAMILAAGLGTRLRPFTDSKPKALAEIKGITLLEILINKLKASGFREIIINVHHFREQIARFLESRQNFGLDIRLSIEEDLLDTGGGLKQAEWFLRGEEPFLLHNVDVLSDIEFQYLMQYHLENSDMATLAVKTRKSNRYFLSDQENNLCGWESIDPAERIIKRQPIGELDRVAFTGIHIISPKIFTLMPGEKIFSIIETYLALAGLHQIKTINCDQNKWMDLGRPEHLERAGHIFPELF